jgi:hypothetical protein
MTKALSQICKEAGLKFGKPEEGAQVSPSSDPGGYWFKDSETILTLERFADQLDPKTGDLLRTKAGRVREGQRLRKEREVAETERKKQADAEKKTREAEIRAKQENDLRDTIRMANPGISDAEVESLLPEMRREQLKQRTKTALIILQREAVKKF